MEPWPQLLGTRTGLNFSTHRQDSVRAGHLPGRVTGPGATDPTRTTDLLAADAAALDDLIVELTVRRDVFTSVSRDSLKFIRREVLPGNPPAQRRRSDE